MSDEINRDHVHIKELDASALKRFVEMIYTAQIGDTGQNVRVLKNKILFGINVLKKKKIEKYTPGKWYLPGAFFSIFFFTVLKVFFFYDDFKSVIGNP